MKLLTNIFVWIFAILLTATVLIYQRMTGPTYPKRISIEVEGQEMKFKLLRSWQKEKVPGKMSHVPLVYVGDIDLAGYEFECKFKRNNTTDDWTKIKLRSGKYKSHEIYGRPRTPELIKEYEEYRAKRYKELGIDPPPEH